MRAFSDDTMQHLRERLVEVVAMHAQVRGGRKGVMSALMDYERTRNCISLGHN